jgi:hypothetical protein
MRQFSGAEFLHKSTHSDVWARSDSVAHAAADPGASRFSRGGRSKPYDFETFKSGDTYDLLIVCHTVPEQEGVQAGSRADGQTRVFRIPELLSPTSFLTNVQQILDSLDEESRELAVPPANPS